MVKNSILSYALCGAPVADGKPCIVFLHGWGRTFEDFNQLSAALSRALPDYAFLLLDLPGFGGSSLSADTGLSLDDYARILNELFDKLEIKKVILVGHSVGGRIAIKCATLFPSRVEKLILIAAAGVPLRSFRIPLLGAGRILFNTLFFAFRDFRFILRLKNLLGALFGSRDYQTSRGALRETLKKVVSEDLRPDAQKISISTFLIWGRNDPTTPLRDAQEYHSLIKGSRLEVLEGGHFVFLEKPDECAEIILSFL